MGTTMTPKGGRAIMERTAGNNRQPHDTDETAEYRRLNFFPTPPWASRVGAEILKEELPTVRRVWEPACGKGHMTIPLSEYFIVVSSDVKDYGEGYGVCDFLDEWPMLYPQDVITNPPFSLATQFIERALGRCRSISILARLAFLETQGRYDLMNMLTRVTVFSERLRCQLGVCEPRRSSATAYGWFTWINGRLGERSIRWTPLGSRQRLNYDEDEIWLQRLV